MAILPFDMHLWVRELNGCWATIDGGEMLTLESEWQEDWNEQRDNTPHGTQSRIQYFPRI